MGRYIAHPLTVNCKSIRDIRQFLGSCHMVSAQDLFGKDHWQPPEEFERLKKGGCVDVSLWTWRQLLSLGYDARFVGGSSGRYGDGHAWVEYFRDGKCFLVEPQYCRVGDAMPRLTTLRYKPKLSVASHGTTVKYFVHKPSDFRPSWRLLVALVGEWLVFWSRFWLRVAPRLPLLLGRKLWKAIRS